MSELGAFPPATPTSWWMLMLKIESVEFRAAEQAMPQKYSCSSPWHCWKMRDVSSDARCSIPWKHPGQRDKETCCLPGCRLGKQGGCDCIWTPFFWLSLSLPHFRQSADRAVAFPFPHTLHSHPHDSPTRVTLSWPPLKFGVIPTKHDLPPC